MNFNYSEDQLAIKDVADRMFRDLGGDDTIKQCFKAEKPFHAELWQQLGGAGLLGTALPAEFGGSDMGMTELCIVLEAQGRAVAPVPLIESIVACALPIAQFGGDSLKKSLLPAVVSGEKILASVRPYNGLQRLAPLSATTSANGWILNGVSTLSLYAPIANGFLVEANLGNGSKWVGYCDASSKGISITTQKAGSGETAGQIRFDNVDVKNGNCIAVGDEADALLEWQSLRLYTAMAAQQVGILREAMQRTATYTNERKQFNRSLSSFQAVAQQAADGYMAVEALQGVLWRALDDLDNGNGLAALSSRVAKFWLCDSGHKAAHIFLHLHGGIGQDLDYPLHRFFTWAKKNELMFGNAQQHSAALGKLIARNPQQVLA